MARIWEVRWLCVVTLGALGALLPVRQTAAQNLVTNGGFDGGLAPWTTQGDVTYSTDDAAGSPASGSARLVAVNGPSGSLIQCIDVPPGTSFLAAEITNRVDSASASGLFTFYFDFLTQANCGTPVAGHHARDVHFSATHDWQRAVRHFALPAGTQSVRMQLSAGVNGPTGSIDTRIDDVRLTPATDLLFDGRFLVSADWETPDGQHGQGVGVQLTDESGYFWFFSAANVELIVKVLDGCALNQRYWVFAGGLTNVKVTLGVRDILTGIEQNYVSAQNAAFAPLQDTNALLSCGPPPPRRRRGHSALL